MSRLAASDWLGLFVAPAVVLAAQSIDYALVHVACREGTGIALNVVSALALAFSVAVSGLAYARWRQANRNDEAKRNAADACSAFLALMAMLIAALSALVQLMMWFPQWLIPPCR
jgi:uncharacterized membrane protein YidH (DUF202 family)